MPGLDSEMFQELLVEAWVRLEQADSSAGTNRSVKKKCFMVLLFSSNGLLSRTGPALWRPGLEILGLDDLVWSFTHLQPDSGMNGCRQAGSDVPLGLALS